MKVVIIGSNHAAISCLLELKRLNKDTHVTLIERNDKISYLGCGTALYIQNDVKNFDDLFYASKDILEDENTSVLLNTEVYDYSFDKKEVYVNISGNTTTIKYDKLVIATGSVPRTLGYKARYIYQAKTYQDALKLADLKNDNNIKTVSIIGGGYIGIELAYAFKKANKIVNIIESERRLLNGYFDYELQDVMKVNLQELNINVYTNTKVLNIDNNIISTNHNEIQSDIIIEAIGFTPNTNMFINKLELDNHNAIKTNNTKTSVNDVYAIGDCATILNAVTKKNDYIPLASNAIKTGVICANEILGNNILFAGVCGASAISIHKLNFVSTGLTLKKALQNKYNADNYEFKDTQKLPFMSNNKNVYINIVYNKENNVILGAQLASYYDITPLIHMFTLAVTKKVTLDEIRYLDMFFLPHFNQPYNYVYKAITNKEKEE